MITKYLVLNVGLNKGLGTVVGMFSTAQAAEAYKDKYDKGLLNDYMIIATLQLDDNGKFISEGFGDQSDNTEVMESLVKKYTEIEPDNTPLEELFTDDPQGIKDEMAELK